MKLALKSVPYRALQKSTSLAITAVFLASVGGGIRLGSPRFLLGILGVLVVTVGYEAAYHQRFRYELTEDTLDIRSGVFSRREREIPYGRIQNVDITRNVFQRLIGLSAVNIETAGGGSTEAVMQYVTPFEAKRLQQEIRRHKRDDTARGEAVDDASGVDDNHKPVDESRDEEELLFEIAPSELALAGVLSFDPRVPGLIIALFTGSIPFVSPIVPIEAPPLVLFGILLVLFTGGIALAWVVGAVSAVLNYWGFRLTRSEGELRYERGLLQRYSGTIPFDKIQAITISDNPLKRRAGYATLAVETAGYGPSQANGRGSEAAVPIGSRDRVERLANEIDPYDTPQFERPPKRIRRRYLVRYLLALGALTAVLYGVAAWFNATGQLPWYLPAVGVLLAPVAAHYKWLHRGYWVGEDHLVTRNGFWSRETKLIAYYRIQTVIDSRTLFQRRWNVATIIADTAGSLSILGTDAAAVDIDDCEADQLREELTSRLRTALADRRKQHRPSAPFEWVSDPSDTPAVSESDESAPESNAVDDESKQRTDDSETDSDEASTDNLDTDPDTNTKTD